MSRVFLTILSLCCLLLFACNNSKHSQEVASEVLEDTSPPIDSSLVELNQEDVIQEVVQDTGVFMTYRRGYCFGTCPVFKSTLYHSGMVEYEGINFVDNMGQHTANISQEQIESIKEKLNEIDYFGMKDAYDNPSIMDIPSINTSVSMGDASHSILDRYQSPKVLRELYKLIDDIYAQLEWHSTLENE